MSHPNYNQQDKETYPGYYYTQQGYANSQYPNGPRNTFQAATSSQLQASYLPVNTNATLGYHPGSLSPYPTQPTFGEVMKNVEHDRDNAYIDRIVPSPRGAGWQGLEHESHIADARNFLPDLMGGTPIPQVGRSPTSYHGFADPGAYSSQPVPGFSPHNPGSAPNGKYEVKTFTCDLCSATFTRKGDCERHRRSVHTRETPYDCQGCGERFTRSDMRKKHWKADPTCEADHWKEFSKSMGKGGLEVS